MPTFIKAGLWTKKKEGYKGELDLDYLISQQSTPGAQGPQGPTGAQGVPGSQGIPGTAGAVGPAGLTWRSSWVSGTSYIANDAVGFGGASYFCILATSGSTAPDLDPTHWALLASQGAQGVQGIQGLAGATGAQGPAGTSASQTLQQVVDLGNTITSGVDVNALSADRVTISGASGNSIIYGNGTVSRSNSTSGGTLLFRFPTNLASGTRQIMLPDASGTVALQQFTTYVSTVEFSSNGSPLVNIAFSDIVGGTVFLSAGTGVYSIGSSGKFTVDKTIITPFAYQGSTTDSGAVRLPIYSSNAIVGYYWLQRISTNDVRLYVVDAAQAPVNPFTLLGTRKLTIDIKVYN